MINTSKITQVRKVGLYFSTILIICALYGMFTKGLNLGIDFTGGFITEYSTSEPVEQSDMQRVLEFQIAGKFELASSEQATNWTVRQPETIEKATSETQTTSKSWLTGLKADSFFQDKSISLELLDSDYIGTQIGKELIDKGGLAMLTALIMILIYLSTRFEWRFAVGAVLALFHDVLIVMGIFAWTQLEFNLTVLASVLAIIGYSLNDSIIVADRIRETMKFNKGQTIDEVINTAIQSTLVRTLITSGTTLATIAAVWWLAGAPLQGFSVALFFGILVGTLSSICISATFPESAGLQADYYQQKEKEARELQESI